MQNDFHYFSHHVKPLLAQTHNSIHKTYIQWRWTSIRFPDAEALLFLPLSLPLALALNSTAYAFINKSFANFRKCSKSSKVHKYDKNIEENTKHTHTHTHPTTQFKLSSSTIYSLMVLRICVSGVVLARTLIILGGIGWTESEWVNRTPDCCVWLQNVFIIHKCKGNSKSNYYLITSDLFLLCDVLCAAHICKFGKKWYKLFDAHIGAPESWWLE